LFLTANSSDVLHPNRANVSKDELRGKLAELYKAKKDDVSVFGFRTHYGGGKSTGFALIYDSAEAMKKFEPHYRLVRYGMASKIEKASRQQRTSAPQSGFTMRWIIGDRGEHGTDNIHRQAAQEPLQGVPGYGQDQGREEGQEISDLLLRGAHALTRSFWGQHVVHDGTGVAAGFVYMYQRLKSFCGWAGKLEGVRVSSVC
jgi:small subunit ribosomal protein S24e